MQLAGFSTLETASLRALPLPLGAWPGGHAGLLISNRPGALSAQAARGAVSADEGMAFLLELEAMATEFARTFKREKAASRESGASEIDCAAAIDDHLNRSRNMDCRTPAAQCSFGC